MLPVRAGKGTPAMTRGLRLPGAISACLFDLDGVLTRTAGLHAAAWKQTFDPFLSWRAMRAGRPPVPFDAIADYSVYVDGRPRADGVREFLRSRGIALPEGTADDPASAETVHGLSRRKNELVRKMMARDGVATYGGSVDFVEAARRAGLRLALVTSSENAAVVLSAAGLDDVFDVKVDGTLARQLGLAGKPAPDTFLEAARRLGVAPGQVAVFEDALSGVAAGRAGGFGLVVGVDRIGQAAELRAAGGSTVVTDLAELIGPR